MPTPDERLPCGIRLDDLVAQVADRLPPSDPEHQAGCAHCRATLAEMEELWKLVRALADEQVRAPAGLLDQVMDQVRKLSRDAWHAVLHGDRGVTRIAASVVAAIARLAASRVPGVGYALGRVQDVKRADGTSTVGVAGSRAVINLDLVALPGTALPDLAARVRREVIGDVGAMTGLGVVEVNVTIADLDTGEDPDRN